jgi:hypothetical protein
MCLLIHQPKGVTFTRAEIADFVSHNADGFGIARGDGKRLHLLRLVGSLSEIQDAYTRHAAGRACILHFRMTTHGATNADNAHPYPITRDIAVAHNGMLSIGNPHDKAMSDTWHLVEFFLRPIARTNPDLLFDPTWGAMMGNLIGTGNKLAIAHRDGRVAIINKQVGVMHKGAWMSNTYAWSAPRPAAPTPTRSPYAVDFGRGMFDDLYTSPDLWSQSARRDSVSAKQDTPAQDTADPDIPDDAILADLWSEVEDAFTKGYEQGVAVWVQNHRDDAVALLASLYSLTSSEAAEWLDEYTTDAVTYLAEAVEAELGITATR